VKSVVSRVVLSFCAALVAGAVPLAAQEARPAAAPASPAQLRRLLAATGEEKLVRDMSTEMLAQARAAAESAAKATGKPVAGLVSIEEAYEPGKLMDIVGSVYASHFSAAEIDEMIRFWESPTGKRLAVLQPQIVEETREALTKWIASHAGAVPGK
jgi:uncharacterized protein